MNMFNGLMKGGDPQQGGLDIGGLLQNVANDVIGTNNGKPKIDVGAFAKKALGKDVNELVQDQVAGFKDQMGGDQGGLEDIIKNIDNGANGLSDMFGGLMKDLMGGGGQGGGGNMIGDMLNMLNGEMMDPAGQQQNVMHPVEYVAQPIAAVRAPNPTDPYLNPSGMRPILFISWTWQVLMIAGIAALISIFVAWILQRRLKKAQNGDDAGNQKIDDLAAKVRSGASGFLFTQNLNMAFFAVVAVAPVAVLYTLKGHQKYDGGIMAGMLVVGAIMSATAGCIGVKYSAKSSAKTAAACINGNVADGFRVAFASGGVMAFWVTGLAMLSLGLSIIVSGPTTIIMTRMKLGVEEYLMTRPSKVADYVDYPLTYMVQPALAVGLGASLVSLFSRVAGSIYSKAADVGADLVGQVDTSIPKDDERNPAVIADCVGDSVSNAGLGADLFESFVASMVATIFIAADYEFLGKELDIMISHKEAWQLIVLPFLVAAAGVLSSMIGAFLVWHKETESANVSLAKMQFALERGMYIASVISLALVAGVVCVIFGPKCVLGWKIYGCIAIGMIAALLMACCSEFFILYYGTSQSSGHKLRNRCLACIPPIIILAGTVVGCNKLVGLYGIAIAAVGTVSTLGISMATCMFGSAADTAATLAAVAKLDDHVIMKVDKLDAVGNASFAAGRGFASGAAAMASIALIAAFKMSVSASSSLVLELRSPWLSGGFAFGVVIPLLLACLINASVRKSVAVIVQEVRRQLSQVTNNRGHTLGQAMKIASIDGSVPARDDVESDSDAAVCILTKTAVRGMIAPAAIAILVPMTVGFFAGPRMLLGFLVGACCCGFILTVVWKDRVEGESGDPYKEATGPAMNSLVKLMCMVSLMMLKCIQQQKNQADYHMWKFGLIPAGVLVVVLAVLWLMGALSQSSAVKDAHNAEIMFEKTYSHEGRRDSLVLLLAEEDVDSE